MLSVAAVIEIVTPPASACSSEPTNVSNMHCRTICPPSINWLSWSTSNDLTSVPFVPAACETAAMPYHEAFWVATAAAAPVIALANVVAGPEIDGLAVAVARRRRVVAWVRGPGLHSLTRTLILISSAYLAFLLGLLMQAALLALSLSALAAGQNAGPPWVAILMAVAGILILAWVLTVTAGVSRELENWKKTTESAHGQD